jgi:DNA-binding IclR family transcriptional regulator
MAERTHYIALVGKVVRVIETLRDAPEGLHLHALAARTGYVKSSVHRILLSLRHHGYVQQDDAGGAYRLGAKFVAVARAANRNVSIVQTARPYLRELRVLFDETVYLAVLRGDRGIFVDVQETSKDLRLVGPLGAEVHFHATAAGKAIAASLPPARRTALLKRLRLTRLTARTITARADLEREWARIRRSGVAVNNEETIVGAVFVAAPVFDVDAQVCAAISVGIPRARYTAPLGRAVATALRTSCQRFSESLSSASYAHDAGAASSGVAESVYPSLLAI